MEEIGGVISAQRFYDALTAELVDNVGGLEVGLRGKLARYYPALAGNPQRWPFHRYSWFRRIEPLVQILEGLSPQGVPWACWMLAVAWAPNPILCCSVR